MIANYIVDYYVDYIEKTIEKSLLQHPNKMLFIVLNRWAVKESRWPINSICLHLFSKYKGKLQWPKLCNVENDKSVLFIGPV